MCLPSPARGLKPTATRLGPYRGWRSCGRDKRAATITAGPDVARARASSLSRSAELTVEDLRAEGCELRSNGPMAATGTAGPLVTPPVRANRKTVPAWSPDQARGQETTPQRDLLGPLGGTCQPQNRSCLVSRPSTWSETTPQRDLLGPLGGTPSRRLSDTQRTAGDVLGQERPCSYAVSRAKGKGSMLIPGG